MTARPDWDPGWKKAILAYRPWPAPGRTRKAGPLDPLTQSRLIHFQICLSAVFMVIAFWFIRSSSTDLVPSLAIILLLGVVMHLIVATRVLPRMTIPTDQTALLPAFRDAMFIGIGVAMAVELTAIVLSFFGAAYSLIVVGAAISLSGLWRIAPTQRLFRQCDERLQAQGKAIRMTEAWRHLLTDLPPEIPQPRPDVES